MHIDSRLISADLKNRRVFLRADLNVPLSNGSIACDFRLKSLQPTLNLLIAKNARIILATHMGRPEGFDKNLSTELLLTWFTRHEYNIQWCSSLEEAYKQSMILSPGSILLLENMRFFEGERSDNIEVCKNFAQTLRTLADYYVNDAFALLHRHDTSITLLPELFSKEDKTIGLLIEREITALSALFQDPKRPFMLIIGGGKVKDKLPFIEKLLDKVDMMLIMPALCFTFLKAQGKNVGLSLVDNTALDAVQRILTLAQEKSVRIIFPMDFMVLMENKEGPVTITDEQSFPAQALGIAVGPKTLSLYAHEISRVKTIFVNGAMGLPERPETLEPLYTLLKNIAQTKVCSIIGGGDSVAAVFKNRLENDITYCSTGGGASLYFLAHGSLPALREV